MHMLTYRSRARGFTLPELAVVIFVIAVLVAVSYFGFSTWRLKVTETELTSDLHNLYSAMESARNWSEGYPSYDEGTPFDGSDSTQRVYKSSDNVTITYFRGNKSDYCVNATSDKQPDVVMHLNTKNGNKEPQKGLCVENDGVVTTFIGDQAPNSCKDGVGRNASLYLAAGIDFADNGDAYMTDVVCNSLRRITPDGTVTTVVSNSSLESPRGVAVAPNGNIYVASQAGNKILTITPLGNISTLAGSGTSGNADGTGTAAQFNQPYDLDVAPDGTVYVADTNNYRIRKVTSSGVVTTLAGSTSGYADGTGTAAQFGTTSGVAVSNDGSEIYISDTGNNRIRKVTSSGVVTTLAGSTSGYADGTGTAARFNNPRYINISKAGTIYVSDTGNSKVRMVTPAGAVTTLAGSTSGYADGTGTAAQFNVLGGVAVSKDWKVYVVDVSNKFVRLIR